MHQQDERYLSATPKERVWIDEYAIDRDVLRATLAAFSFKNEKDALQYGKSVRTKPHLAGLIRDYFTTHKAPTHALPTIDELRQFYIDIYYQPESNIGEKLKALTAYERVSGFIKLRKGVEGDEFDVLNDIVG